MLNFYEIHLSLKINSIHNSPYNNTLYFVLQSRSGNTKYRAIQSTLLNWDICFQAAFPN